MNLVFVCEYYYPEIGGLEKSTHRLAVALRNKGHLITIVAPLLPNTSQSSYLQGIHIVRSLNSKHTPFTASPLALALYAAADAICVFGICDDPKARIWEPIFEQNQIPRILKIGTHGDTSIKKVPKEILLKFSGIFCQNDAIQVEARGLGFADRVCYRIQNGLNIEKWKEELLSRNKARNLININDGLTICAIGRFVIRKRFPIIIKAFQEFSGQNTGIIPNLILHGADFGQSDGEEEIIRSTVYAAQKSGCNIKIISPEIETSITLAASDVSIALGTREGAPNVILESLASNVPVIVSDIPGHTVYIDNNINGLYCSSDNNFIQNDLVKCFNFIKDSNKLYSLKENCYLKSLSFDINLTSTQYLLAITDNISLMNNPFNYL